MNAKRTIVIALISVVILVLIAFLVLRQAERQRAQLPKLYEVPAFEFTERSGEPFGLDDMKGKINVVDFIFTRCPGPCPLMSSHMSRLYDIYRDYDQVQFVSFTVDPEYDSLAVLREYAKEYGVTDDRWVFVRAEKPEIKTLYEQGFKLGGELPHNHSTKFVLVDQEGMIRGYYSTEDDVSLNILQSHLKELAKQAS